jgi:hypothetical protein
MRYLSITLIFMIVTLSVFGQSERWKQKNARINFAFTPQIEYVKTAGTFSPNLSFTGAISFNNTFYLGGYLSKKIIRHYIDYDALPTTSLDAVFQHGGIEFLYAMRMGLYRTKGGHYVHPKIKILFGTRLGVGLVWLDDINKARFTRSDYFAYIQPMVGIGYPINDYISIQGGICGTAILKIQVLEQFLSNKDFLGPGAYMSLKFTLFR